MALTEGAFHRLKYCAAFKYHEEQLRGDRDSLTGSEEWITDTVQQWGSGTVSKQPSFCHLSSLFNSKVSHGFILTIKNSTSIELYRAHFPIKPVESKYPHLPVQ